MSRLGIRHRLLLAVMVTVALALAVLALVFNLVLARTLDRDAHDLARTRAAAQLALLGSARGRLTVGEAPDDATGDAYIWIASRTGMLEEPRAGASANAAARSLARGRARFASVPESDVLLYAAPAVVGGRRLGTVIAGVALAPYEETRRVALIASSIFAAILLLLVGVAARWLLASSFRPVRRMTRQAAAWSERDLDQRFGLREPRDELTELAATLDGLLDRLAASLRREQRFSAELSHELRTPLARVMAESELALRRERSSAAYREALGVINRNAAQLSRIVDALVAAARHQAGSGRGTADAYEVASDAAAGCTELAIARELRVEIERPPAPVRLGVEADLAERILQPLLDNACRYGAGTVTVSIERASGAVRYTIADEGPGVDTGEEERIFEPGVRGTRGAAGGAAGAGLGLPLARRLARSVSGDIEALADEVGGRFVVTLPTA